MKKIFILACMALSGLCVSAQEQGDIAVGLNFGVAPCLESGASLTNLGIGAKLQYNVSNPVRLEAAFDYGFKDKGFDVMTVGINGHYIFKVGEKFNIYPLVGVGYARLGYNTSLDMGFDYGDEPWAYNSRYDYYDDDNNDDGDMDLEDMTLSSSKFYFNAGVGAEYALSTKFSIGVEAKYQYMKGFSRLPISIGISYKF